MITSRPGAARAAHVWLALLTTSGCAAEVLQDASEAPIASEEQELAAPPRPARSRPNLLLIVADDLGYSDLGAFGGEIHTPNLDRLAADGRLLANHHSGVTCAPTRSMLISGTDHHRVGLGTMGAGSGEQAGQPGYEGYLNDKAISVAEVLRDNGYHTYIAGKWHLGSGDTQTPKDRGYESSYVLLGGVSTHFAELSDPPTQQQQRRYREDGAYVTPPADFYSTEFYTDKLISYIDANHGDGKPFYAFAAYTSPHWPLQVPDDYLDRYRGKYDEGYDVIRARRFARQKRLGLIPRAAVANPLLPASDERPTWDQLTPEEKAYEARRQELYAALVENLDFHVGRLIQHLKDIGEYDNTLIFFQSDNGPEGANVDNEGADNSLENLGRAGSYIGYGSRWAEVSATPLRLWKQFLTEGGASVPAIARVPRGLPVRYNLDALTHVTDIVPTFLAAAGIAEPGEEYNGRSVHPISGKSLLTALTGRTARVRGFDEPLSDEQYGHRYVIRNGWKLLWLGPPFGSSTWALYDLRRDRAEINDLSARHPQLRDELIAVWEAYAAENGVIPVPGGYGDL